MCIQIDGNIFSYGGLLVFLFIHVNLLHALQYTKECASCIAQSDVDMYCVVKVMV